MTALCPPSLPSLEEAQGSQQSPPSCPPALGSLVFASSPYFPAALTINQSHSYRIPAL